MAQSVVIKGAEIKTYVGGKLYPEVQQIQYTIDYGEYEIHGIDSAFPQEIASSKVTVNGSVTGLRIKFTGGLQGYHLRTKINQILHAPYVSLRIQDRQTEQDLFWLPQMKVSSESFQVVAKGIVVVNFKFKGIIPYSELDVR